MSVHAALVWALLQGAPTPGPWLAVEAIAPGAPELHFFSARQIPLTLRVHGAQGKRLELEVRIYQLAHALAVPIGPPVVIAAGVELGASAWHEFPFQLDVPAVASSVTWELCFSARFDGEGSLRPAGSARLELHPPDLLAPLRAHAREQTWFVSDRPGTLKTFLEKAAIPFHDLDRQGGRDALDQCRIQRRSAGTDVKPCFVLAVRTQDERETRASAAFDGLPALVFEELSAFALRWEPERARVTLDLGLIAHLLDDPRAQIALAQAIELTRRTSPSDE